MVFRSPFPDVPIPATPLTDYVLGHARTYGSKTALIDASTGESMSYDEIVNGVQSVAAGLAQRGFARGDVLGIFAPSSLDYAVALYAVASLGGVTTPANAMSTSGELARQLVDAGASYLLTTSALLSTTEEARANRAIRETFVIGDAPGATSFSALLATAQSAPSVEIDPKTVAMLPYSSGTTGLPKGVMLTHQNLVANIAQLCHAGSTAMNEIYFGVPPLSHIYGVWLLGFVLQRGATMVFLPRFDLDLFLAAIQCYGVTDVIGVPPIVLALANAPQVDDYDLTSLHRVHSGGAPLDGELARRCQERIGCPVTQGSGMTETGPVTHVMPLPGNADKPGSIGTTVPNTECRIVDIVTGSELGRNETGELWIRGPQVMKGYLNRPDATAATIDDDGWLHTGDIACVDEAGDFTIVDRLKELIKYRAYHVAPAELEAVLLAHPAVADAAVTPFPDPADGEIPKAWIVLRDDVGVDELTAYVAARVAPYKKIRAVEFIDSIPKSPSGKILRRILIDRDRAAASAREETAGVR